MKDHLIQILLSIILTTGALFLGFIFSIETPIKTTENFFLLWAVILNGLWFIPYTLYYQRRKMKKANVVSLIIFSAFILPPLFLRVYTPKFKSEIWKSEINENRTYGGTPAYLRGEMVEDLIESEILLKKTLNEIELILGPNNFQQEHSDSNTVWYFYQRKSFFDGCDKIFIEFENGLSENAGIGGCD